jgi:hypothetical protein
MLNGPGLLDLKLISCRSKVWRIFGAKSAFEVFRYAKIWIAGK